MSFNELHILEDSTIPHNDRFAIRDSRIKNLKPIFTG